MQVDVYNLKNEKADSMDLPEAVFKVKWNPDLVQQALMVQLANRRKPIAHTKDRSDVSGGGKKPWKQKGTGRARQGSSRSPLWKGGGVTFGPRNEKKFAKKINVKMKRLAFFSILSRKLKDGELKVVQNIEMPKTKTKSIAATLTGLFKIKEGILVIGASKNKSIKKSVSNLEKVDAISPLSLNAYDLMRYKNVLIEKEAIKEMVDHYRK